MIGRRAIGLLLLLAGPGGAAYGRCLPSTAGPGEPSLRRARVAAQLGVIAAVRARRRSHQLALLDWDMQGDSVAPGTVVGAAGQFELGEFQLASCPNDPDMEAGDYTGTITRAGWSAQFGDPSTPVLLRVGQFRFTDSFTQDLDSAPSLPSFGTSAIAAEARILDLAQLFIARLDGDDTRRGWFARLDVPRAHATGALLVTDGDVDFIEAGLAAWPWTRARIDLDARVGWLRDEAVGIATLGLERGVIFGHILPRLEVVGEVGGQARLRTASLQVTATTDTTVRTDPSGCPWLCYLVVGAEASAALRITDAAVVEGITGVRWAQGAEADVAVLIGLRPITVRLGAYGAQNRFDTLTRLPDAVGAVERGLRADIRIGL